MVDDEALAHEPAYGDAVLEERVHPGVGVGVVGGGGTVDGVAAGVGGHGHDGHAVGEAAVDGLEIFVVEGLGEQDGGDGFNQLSVGEEAVGGFVGGDAGAGVGDRLRRRGRGRDERWPGGAARTRRGCCLKSGQTGCAVFFKLAGFGDEAVAFGVEDGAHVSLSYGGDGAKNGFFAAAGAGAVAGYQSVVVGADHQHIAQGRGFGVGGVGGVV